MDVQLFGAILGASAVTKAWVSLVFITTMVDYLKIVYVERHIIFLNPEDIFKRPFDTLLSFSYVGELSISNAVSLYNTLMVLGQLDTAYMRSGRDYIIKLCCLLMYVFFIFYVSKYTFEILIDKLNCTSLKIIVESLKSMFRVLSLWNVMTLNLMYYGCRFQGMPNFNGLFNIHPVFLFLFSLSPVAFSPFWPLTFILFLPGHLFFYIDQILSKLNKDLPLPSKIPQQRLANYVILAMTMCMGSSQYVALLYKEKIK